MKALIPVVAAALFVSACADSPTSPILEPASKKAAPQATATGVWDTNAPMPSARGALVAGTVGDRIYVVGGAERWCCEPTVPVTEVYDPDADTWTVASPPPDDDMWGPSSAVVDGNLYVIGGWPSGSTNTRVYDPLTDDWDYLATLPEAYSWGHTSAVVNDEIYVIGGSHGPHVTKYSPDTDTWTTGLAPLPVNSSSVAGATIDGLIYVVGVDDNLQIYDPVADSWSLGAAVPKRTWRPSVSAISGLLYLFGGSTASISGGGDLPDAQVYDPNTDSWDSIPDMPTNRYWSAAAVNDGTVYVFGGWGINNDVPLALNESFSFDPPHKEACKNGGWEAFGFKNQGQCVRFVETGKDSR